MRQLLILLSLALFGLFSCSRSTAGLTIPANQTFLLGEYADYGYTASIDNEGTQTVDLIVRNKSDKRAVENFSLAPGDKTSVAITAEQEVVMANENAAEANLMVVMSRNVEGMRYLEYDSDVIPPTAERLDVDILDTGGEPTRSAAASLQAGEAFLLGEGTRAGYSADLSNSGAPIEVSVRDRESGDQTQGFGLGKAGKATINLRPNEVIFLINTGKRATRVKAKFSTEVSGARVVEM